MERVYPGKSNVNFVLCEDIRQEISGKLLFVGVFAGGDIRLHRKDSSGFYVIPALAVFFQFADPDSFGKFKGRFELYPPDSDKPIQQSDIGEMEKSEGRVMNFYANIHGLKMDRFGLYKAVVSLDDKQYVHTFEVCEG